ncbi:MAG: TetM/TetW/TetO/TetS family tetracycline resistance ribosomal protection protein [Oscillospiraceae bacterium]|nr:TetM/TetW/TetO/TetS family tetracycline resistance ribosomal protection protein [Oscillospiraceae bacterium]
MDIINLGVFAHVDAGKTSTVERLLFMNGATRRLGSVDDGTAATDSMEIERSRGISVRSASAAIDLPGLRLNLIDTPGHMDFTAEVQRSLLAVDCGLLIISAAEGVQSQTELFFNAMEAAKLPLIIFVNKIDRTGVDANTVFSEIKRKLSPDIFPLNAVISQGSRECGTGEYNFNDDEMLSLCSRDAGLESVFLKEGEVIQKQLEEGLFRLLAKGEAYPLIYGSAFCNVGLEKLSDAILRLPRVNIGRNAGENVSGKIYKIEHDKVMGKAAYVRLFSGRIQNRDAVALLNGDTEEARTEKVTQIKHFSAGTRLVDAGEISAGDIAVLYGLATAKAGDIVGEICAARNDPPLKTTPLFNVKVADGSPNPTPLLTAVRELAEEDPLLSCEWEPDERELTVSIMGEIQIEVLRHLLAERYGINAEFSNPTVIYKETVMNPGKGFESYTMPKPCWAVIELSFEPLPTGGGYIFESAVKGGQIPYKYQAHIKTALPGAMKQGLYGWEVTDVKITLSGGGWHFIHTHPMDFFLATPVAFMNGMVNCGSRLLEPFLRIKIAAPEELSGKIMGDIINMRGEFDSPVISGGTAEIEAGVPLAEAMDYPVRLSSLSSGKARYASNFDGYRPCPLELGKTTKRRGVDPLDRARWILHMRQAL